jgi:PAS domain S-box-containing protein
VNETVGRFRGPASDRAPQDQLHCKKEVFVTDHLQSSVVSEVTKEDFEAILDTLAEGIVVLGPDERIRGVNNAACDILEVEKHEALQSDCPCLLGNQMCESVVRIKESIRRHEPVRDVQAQIQTRSGKKEILLFQTAVLRGPEGEHRGSVVLFRDITELVRLREDVARPYRLHNIVGKGRSMQAIFRLIEEVADSEATVLIEGESGTGKELVARAIHHLSSRAAGPFVAVSCSALAEGVLESELFGHVRGAFTGATRDKRGRFEAAAGGTIFLDEIGDLAPGIQVKLLRVLQERVIERVGGDETIPVDIRVIAATHRPLGEMVADGRFRQDLYYRLRVVPIRLPALRERRDDLPLLAQHFIERFREETGRAIEGVSPEAMTELLDYPWPGNVRELENAIEYAFVKTREGWIEPEHLPPEINRGREATAGPTGKNGDPAAPVGAAASSVELPAPEGVQRRVDPAAGSLEEVLRATGWNVAKAARRLGVSRTTLYKRIEESGLRRPVD